jgi:hypothetical protein
VLLVNGVHHFLPHVTLAQWEQTQEHYQRRGYKAVRSPHTSPNGRRFVLLTPITFELPPVEEQRRLVVGLEQP